MDITIWIGYAAFASVFIIWLIILYRVDVKSEERRFKKRKKLEKKYDKKKDK